MYKFMDTIGVVIVVYLEMIVIAFFTILFATFAVDLWFPQMHHYGQYENLLNDYISPLMKIGNKFIIPAVIIVFLGHLYINKRVSMIKENKSGGIMPE